MFSYKYFLISAVLLFVFTPVLSQSEYNMVKVGGQAPGFTVKTISNKVISLESLKGKYVLLNFFATWCKPCLEEMPYMEKDIHQAMGNKDIVVLAIGREHNVSELQLFNESKGFTFHIAADPQRTIYEMYATKYIPRNYLIDRNGKIIYEHSGFSKSEFDKMVKLIQQQTNQ